MNISGSSALVTGGASGLGLATVRNLHAAGAKVVIVDLPSSDGEAVAKGVGEGAAFVGADVRDAQAVQGAVDAASELAPLRIAINCAGMGYAIKTVGKEGPHDLEKFERTIAINLIGTFNVIRLAAARMAQGEEIDGERGVIVNTASIAAFEIPVRGGSTSSVDTGRLRLARYSSTGALTARRASPNGAAFPFRSPLADRSPSTAVMPVLPVAASDTANSPTPAYRSMTSPSAGTASSTRVTRRGSRKRFA